VITPLYIQLSPLNVGKGYFNEKIRIPGLQLWLDASDSSTLFDATSGGALVTTDGATVARWEDKSGYARHATQATSNARPLFKSAIKNGRNALRFDGVNDQFRCNDSDGLDLNAFSIFAVVIPSSYSIGGSKFPAILNKGDFATAAGSNYELVGNSSAQWQAGIVSGGAGAYSTTAINFNNCQIVGMSRLAGGGVTVYKNGVAGATSTAFSGSLNNISTPLGVGGRGTGTQTSVDSFIGDILEILIYNINITTTQRQGVESYLNNKWSIY
jgi:hypothetical protein